jgi:hypothetical protein
VQEPAGTTVTYTPGKRYTIPNEEYRAALLGSLLPSDPLYTQLSDTDASGAYKIPSIEGFTFEDSTLPN